MDDADSPDLEVALGLTKRANCFPTDVRLLRHVIAKTDTKEIYLSTRQIK